LNEKEKDVRAQHIESNPQISDIQPGPFPPRKFPRPIEAVCIQVEKIYDACSQKRCPTIQVERKVRNATEIVSFETRHFKSECELTQIQDDPPLVRANVKYSYWVRVVYLNEDGDEKTAWAKETHEKSVVLFGTDEMFCKVEAVLEPLGCMVETPSKISCEVGEYIVIKSALEVQLLVPSYGFCPPPPECEELPTLCEEFLEAPPPPLYPPQPWDLEDNDG